MDLSSTQVLFTETLSVTSLPQYSCVLVLGLPRPKLKVGTKMTYTLNTLQNKTKKGKHSDKDVEMEEISQLIYSISYTS